MIVRVWHEGRRVYENDDAIAVECDGTEITVTDENDDILFLEDEWDELAVN